MSISHQRPMKKKLCFMSLLLTNFAQATLFSNTYDRSLNVSFLSQGLWQSDITLCLSSISVIKTRNESLQKQEGKCLEMLHSWQLTVTKEWSPPQFREQPGWGHHPQALVITQKPRGARKLGGKGSGRFPLEPTAMGGGTLWSWMLRIPLAISQPSAGTWEFELITTYPWLGNRINKKRRCWQLCFLTSAKAKSKSGKESKECKQCEIPESFRTVREEAAFLLRKEKPLLLTTFHQAETAPHASPLSAEQLCRKSTILPHDSHVFWLMPLEQFKLSKAFESWPNKSCTEMSAFNKLSCPMSRFQLSV